VRASFSILLSLAVLTAFVEAPFQHTHRHEATQRHAGPFLHLHLKSAQSGSTAPEFRGLDPNEDVQYQSWFAAAPLESAATTAEMLPELFSIPVLECSGRVAAGVLRTGHDPPHLTPRNPRAPPA
jgi:hypothetical protein